MREVREETGIELMVVTPLMNEAFVVEYEGIALHHTALIYQGVGWDESRFDKEKCEEDVAGCRWVEKAELGKVPVSKVVRCLQGFGSA